jgi:hypothetical protein
MKNVIGFLFVAGTHCGIVIALICMAIYVTRCNPNSELNPNNHTNKVTNDHIN